MSAPHNHGNDHGHHDDHDPADDVHVSVKGYVTGFILAVVLTVIPFWLVMGGVFTDSRTAGIVLLAIGAVQVVVHMIYFLHMNTKSEGGWNMLALLFTTVMLLIAVGGSLWVMHHMNKNMMPPMTPQEILHGP